MSLTNDTKTHKVARIFFASKYHCIKTVGGMLRYKDLQDIIRYMYNYDKVHDSIKLLD